jgi:hypothetical protein
VAYCNQSDNPRECQPYVVVYRKQPVVQLTEAEEARRAADAAGMKARARAADAAGMKRGEAGAGNRPLYKPRLSCFISLNYAVLSHVTTEATTLIPQLSLKFGDEVNVSP